MIKKDRVSISFFQQGSSTFVYFKVPVSHSLRCKLVNLFSHGGIPGNASWYNLLASRLLPLALPFIKCMLAISWIVRIGHHWSSFILHLHPSTSSIITPNHFLINVEVNIWMVEGNYVSLLKDVDCPKTKFKIRSNHVMAAHVAFHKAHMMTETSDQQFWSFGYKVNDPKAILCVPVITPEEQCVAVFDLYRTSEQPSYGEKELKISLVLAGWIGAAIQQNRDRIMLQEQKKINNMVLELMNKFYNGDIDLDEVLGCLMRLTKERTLAEKGKFYLIKTDSDDLQATVLEQGLYDDNLYRKSGKVSLLNSNTVAGSVARHRRSVLLKNLMLDRRFNRHFERSTGQYKKCIMALPIKGGRTVYGVLELENKDAPFPNYNFTPADEEFTRNIWQYCSLALSFDYVRLKYPTTLYNLKNDKLVVLKQIKPCPHDMEIVFDDDTTQPPSGFHLFSWYIGVNSKSNMPLYAFYMLKEVIGIENIDPELCKEFVLTCRKMYRNNPYHNFEHAFNVCHCLYSIVTRNKDAFTTLEANALLVAALCHDLDHLGVTNSFLMISDHNIYTLYGESCLENYHNMMGNLIWENCNFLINQTEEEYRLFIKEIKYDIIATDLSNYFKQRLKINVYMNTHSKFDFMLQEHKEFTRSMIMTCGDLSGSCKSFPVVMTMVTNLYKEFYRQGDMERDMGYTPLPIMDKNKIQSVPLEQIQFLNVLVLPCTNIVRFIFPNCSDIHMLATRVRDTWEQAAKVANTDAKWQDFVPKKKSVLCTLHTILGTECKYAI
ncbi:unnamed protein product [Brassicogethes aeneus]|uniref:Phosphodiesterase n=1 Tax=Brassicogethes aeneus TaxID=1431903 RepID=A0A9P0AWC5_BRAAE|nr:unnamed protein product [Brassicogethes aeneus]